MPAPARTTVLVIDPDALQRRMLQESLQARYQAIAVGSLAQAREAIVIHRPSIILLELDEPDGDGLQLIRQIRSDPTTRDIIICCVTRRSGVRDKVSAFQAGADDYVVKPINPESFPYRVVLLTRIRQVSPFGTDRWSA